MVVYRGNPCDQMSIYLLTAAQPIVLNAFSSKSDWCFFFFLLCRSTFFVSCIHYRHLLHRTNCMFNELIRSRRQKKKVNVCHFRSGSFTPRQSSSYVVQDSRSLYYLHANRFIASSSKNNQQQSQNSNNIQQRRQQ